jgi:hypothetical protein
VCENDILKRIARTIYQLIERNQADRRLDQKFQVAGHKREREKCEKKKFYNFVSRGLKHEKR